MKWLLALLLASVPGWDTEYRGDELVIINYSDYSIICYVYYDDGHYKKLKVQPHDESRSVTVDGLVEVECF
jgi:hypothetical protein